GPRRGPAERWGALEGRQAAVDAVVAEALAAALRDLRDGDGAAGVAVPPGGAPSKVPDDPPGGAC
ncbi:MAG: hypothetical protein K0A98_14265, partial [Trueperaceae bacterium]|nr:hypothetical protein [Trueperaceae bacterium]